MAWPSTAHLGRGLAKGELCFSFSIYLINKNNKIPLPKVFYSTLCVINTLLFTNSQCVLAKPQTGAACKTTPAWQGAVLEATAGTAVMWHEGTPAPHWGLLESGPSTQVQPPLTHILAVAGDVPNHEPQNPLWESAGHCGCWGCSARVSGVDTAAHRCPKSRAGQAVTSEHLVTI